jgi:alpha(1,3/1,4) fucosyltransferase
MKICMNKMDRLKICYCDVWPEWNEENFIEPILAKHFNIVIDNNKPDLLIHSTYQGMMQTPKYKCRKLAYMGENFKPEQIGSDYSISFDPQSENNYRLPLWQTYIVLKPWLKDKLYNKVMFKENEFLRFCSFVVSNPNNFIRNSVFTSISSHYRRVHSYGRYMTNNLELQQVSKSRYWRDAKIEYFNKIPHKFNIAYENTPRNWYITEKIMDAFLCGSIPIYNGGSKVVEDFNEEAFVNANKIQGWDLLTKIRELDSNWEKYMEIYNKPVFTEEQKKKLDDNLDGLENWIIERVKNG